MDTNPLDSELRALFDAVCDETITDKQRSILDARIDADHEARRLLLEYVQLQLALDFSYRGERANQKAFRKLGIQTPNQGDGKPAFSPVLGFLNRLPEQFHPGHHPAKFFGTVVVFTTLFWAVLFAFVWKQDRADFPNERTQHVATITHTKDAVWAEGQSGAHRGARLLAGRRLKIETGLVHLMFRDGARVVVEGPATLRVDAPNLMTLEEGRLLARVSEQAKGFTVETPTVDVVDLGTEFGVHVTEKETELQVFKGKVQARRHDDARGQVHMLVAGQATVFGNSPQQVFFVKEKKMNRAIYLGLAAVMALGAPASSDATMILVDFGHENQETSLPAWNNISGAGGFDTLPTTSFNLNDAGGTDSGIDLVLSVSPTAGTGISSITSPNYDGSYPIEVSGFPMSANRDSAFVLGGGTITATLSMLDPTATYDFLFYGATAAGGNDTTWTVTGSNNGSDSIANVVNNSSAVALVSGIIPDGSNEISILMSSAGTGRWNVLQITENLAPVPVPEPTTGAVLGLGGMIVLGFSRRRRLSRRSKPASGTRENNSGV